jgi:hypothetical protein
MVKHISKIIKETELYKDLQRRKIAKLEEFLPGISKNDISIGFEGYPIRKKNWRQEQHEKKIFGEVSEIEHKKSTEKPYSNE